MLHAKHSYPVAEIFNSIQGEGFHSGSPSIFVRLAGCNLNCHFCDTDKGSVYSADELDIALAIENELHRYSPSVRDKVNIVITGGEPTIHPAGQLIHSLILRFRNLITMESNGSGGMGMEFQILRRWGQLWTTISPKIGIDPDCEKYFADGNWYGDELKIVLDPKMDPEILKALPSKLGKRFKHYYLQPCSEDFKPAFNFVQENPRWKLSIQIHKILGVR